MEKMMVCLKSLILALFAFIFLISIFSLADEIEQAEISSVKDKDAEPASDETVLFGDAEVGEKQQDMQDNSALDSITSSDAPQEDVLIPVESSDSPAVAEAVVVPLEERKPAIVELETPDQLKRILLEKQDNAGAPTAAQPQLNAAVAPPSGSPIQAIPQSNSSSNLEKLPNVTVSGFNYAAMDAGAIIMAHNSESQGSSNLLINDPDKYSLSPCSATQWFVIGLSEEILVTTVEVANYERYSSSVKTFQLYGAHKFPADEWTLLGEFERPSHRGTESFTLAQPKWARYVRFVVQSNHGNEVYCTLSKIRVFGQTTLETLREDLALSQQQIEAVRTTISDRQMQALAGNPSTTTTNNNGTSNSHSEAIHPDTGVPVVDSGPESNQANNSSSPTTTSSVDSNTKQQNATIQHESSSSASGNVSDSTQQQPSNQNAKEETILNSTTSQPTTTTTTAAVDTFALSIVNGKPPASMDNIFKTLMDKVKGVEIDVSVLKACLESNNDKVKVALQFLDSNIKELKEDFAAFASKQGSNTEDSDRMYVLEKEVESLSKRQMTLETINFATMFMVMWLWYRG